MDNILVQITTIIIATLTVYKLSFERDNQKYGKYAFNSNTMLYVFVYFFFVIAPLYQYNENVVLWGGLPPQPIDYFISNLYILLGLFVYELMYKTYLKNNVVLPDFFSSKNVATTLKTTKSVILVTISTLIILFAYRNNPILLVLREVNVGGVYKELEFEGLGNTSLDLLFGIFLRPIPVIVLIFYNIFYPRTKKKIKILLLSLTLLTNFPLALSRFYVAALYLPLLVSYFPMLLRKDILMKLVLLLGVMYVFPFLNQGRQVTNIDQLHFSMLPNYEMFGEGHFDAYQNALRVYKHGTITYGNQLLGAIFFFVPRNIWDSKPIGSGGFIAEQYKLDFDHISLNYWGEGYINFGIMGIILFSIILAYLNAAFDNKSEIASKDKLRLCIFLVYIGTMIFFLRGDLISSIAYLLGLIGSVMFVYKIIAK